MRRVVLLFPSVIGLPLMLGVASAGPVATFDSTPASGPPNTAITVSSITPCPPLPPGVPGPPIARVALSQGSQAIASVELPVDGSGAWSGTLVVPGSAGAGDATIQAFCFSSAQAEGATLAYEPRTFTVTAVSTPAPPPTPPAAPKPPTP